jgi:hypothetical protein
MKITILVFLLFFHLTLLSQKNSLWLGHSFTKAEQESLSFKNPTLKKINTFGLGFLFLLEHHIKKSKVSSYKLGLELSSVRQGFYLNGFANYIFNTTIKIPILYCFKFPLSKKTVVLFDLGLKLQFLTGSHSTTIIWNNTTQLEINTKSGIFPLLNFNVGTEIDLIKKRKLGILIGINKGFLNYGQITYTTISPKTEITSDFNGTFYEIKLNWKLNFANH